MSNKKASFFARRDDKTSRAGNPLARSPLHIRSGLL
jgi:hypothetical protein